MSESMMVRGPDRIAANTAIPSASPIDDYTQPVVLSQAAPMISEMPPSAMITLNIPQNYVIFLAVIGILLIGVIAGIAISSRNKKY